MATKQPVTLGFKTRTGRAVVVALGGRPDSPEILAKVRIDVATTFDEGAVFHVAQELPVAAARARVESSEARFTEHARAELAALVARLGVKVIGAGMVAGPAKALPPLEAILKSHALVHAAEGELYRRVFAEAGATFCARPARVPADVLTARVTTALGITSTKVASRLAAMGKASGRPWAADQKQATLAAWIALVTASR